MGESTIYKFNRNGKWEVVEREDWCWIAIYQDGTELKQFDDNGIFHQFKEIDQANLIRFQMVSTEKPGYTLVFDPERMKLIHYYKRIRLNVLTSEEIDYTVYCFGYETNTFGTVNKTNLVILPSGETILTEDCNIINFN